MPKAELLDRERAAANKVSSLSEWQGIRFHPLPHVVSVRAGDVTVLMDGAREVYYTLDGVSGRIWELAKAGMATWQIADQMASEYDVSCDELKADIESTLQRFLEQQLIAGGPRLPVTCEDTGRSAGRSNARHREFRQPSVLRCGLMILAVKTALRMRGFSGTLRWVRRRVTPVPRPTSVSTGVVKATAHAVAMAGALYPGRALCLEQSLVLYYVLKRQGVAVTYCQGVQPHPFQAHAWVEYHGEAISDVAEHVKVFARFPDVLP